MIPFPPIWGIEEVHTWALLVMLGLLLGMVIFLAALLIKWHKEEKRK